MGIFYKGELLSLNDIAKRWSCGIDTVMNTLSKIASRQDSRNDSFSFFSVASLRQDKDLESVYEINECIYDENGEVWIDRETNTVLQYEAIYSKLEGIKLAEKEYPYLLHPLSVNNLLAPISVNENNNFQKGDEFIKELKRQILEEQDKLRELNEQLRDYQSENNKLRNELRKRDPKTTVNTQRWRGSIIKVMNVVINILSQEPDKWIHDDFKDACRKEYSDCLTQVIDAAWENLPEEYKKGGGRPRKTL